jgi:hypothetical protein
MVVTSKTDEDKREQLEKRKQRAKQVLLEIVRQAGGELRGRLKLFKAFYLAHLLYADSSPGYLTEWPIVRMPHGPGIHAADQLLVELLDEGALAIESTRRPTELAPPEVYREAQNGKSEPPLPPPALKAISEAVSFVRDKSGLQLSEWTHEFSRSWMEAKDGDELNIYIDMIPEEEYLEQKKRVNDIWMAIEWQDRPPAEDDERSP